MYYEKQIGDWVWPGFISGLAWVSLWYAVELAGTQAWQLIIVLIGIISLAAAIANLLEYRAERQLHILEQQNTVMTYSTDTRLFEEARKLASQSPELAGELARKIGRPDLILFPTRQGRKALFRIAGSEVTLQFALKALNLSNDISMVAMNKFDEGTYLYDPNHEMPDRQQWKQFNWLLSQEGMVTRYVPGQVTNHAPMWIPPWSPARVLENWLLPNYLLDVLKPYIVDESAED